MERARESSKNQKGFYEGTVIETQVRSWHYGLNLFKIDACCTMVRICLKLPHVALSFVSV